MKPTEPERITASETKIGDVLINKDRAVQVVGVDLHSDVGAYKLVCRDANAPSGVRPRVMWIGVNTPLHRLMSNTEIATCQAASLVGF